MTDTIDLEPDPYHTLSGRDRDYLLAAAVYATKRDELPAGSTVGETVGQITGTVPARKTTSEALKSLANADLIERVDGEPTVRSKGVRVTEEGYRTLARGATRLDAAATVEGDV